VRLGGTAASAAVHENSKFSGLRARDSLSSGGLVMPSADWQAATASVHRFANMYTSPRKRRAVRGSSAAAPASSAAATASRHV
jgi:hypothetical protein